MLLPILYDMCIFTEVLHQNFYIQLKWLIDYTNTKCRSNSMIDNQLGLSGIIMKITLDL